jgi:hypothetical protein
MTHPTAGRSETHTPIIADTYDYAIIGMGVGWHEACKHDLP